MTLVDRIPRQEMTDEAVATDCILELLQFPLLRLEMALNVNLFIFYIGPDWWSLTDALERSRVLDAVFSNPRTAGYGS